MKIDIKILKPGTYTVEAPENWEELNTYDKIDWAERHINHLTDEEVIDGMSDIDIRKLPGHSRFDSDSLEVHSIVDSDEKSDPYYESKAWKVWFHGDNVWST